MRHLFAFSLVVVIGLSGCAEDDDTGPQRVQIFGINPTTSKYELFVERLNTLTSAQKIRGAVATLRGGGSLVIEEAFVKALTAADEEELLRSELVRGDDPVQAVYEKVDGVLYPKDWETLLMMSLYHHIEKGMDFYRALGVDTSALHSIKCYFNVRVTSFFLAWGAPVFTDNAAYTPVADAFLLFPDFFLNEGIPLVLNQGVVLHEMTHAIKHRLLHGSERIPVYIADNWSRSEINAYRADDEGLADFFAATYLGDPNFIKASISGLDRQLDKERIFSDELFEDLDSRESVYNPYKLGSAIASWLWAIGLDPDERILVAERVLDTLDELRDNLRIARAPYSTTFFIEQVVQHLTPSLQTRACQLLDTRLQGDFRNIPTCNLSL